MAMDLKTPDHDAGLRTDAGALTPRMEGLISLRQIRHRTPLSKLWGRRLERVVGLSFMSQ
jgi:hypothetical protein